VTKRVFRVNLAQIRSAVPEIFHTQQKLTDSAKNITLRSSMRVVKIAHKWVMLRRRIFCAGWLQNAI